MSRARPPARRRAAPPARRRAPVDPAGEWGDHRALRRRLVGLLVAIALALAVIGVRLVEVQARDRADYVALGLDQRRHMLTLAPERGAIFDRQGADLAVSVEVESIYADPRVVRDPEAYARKLAPVLGADQVDLRNRLAQPGSAFTYLARKAEPALARRVRALRLPGVGFVPETRRFYPGGTLAAPLLGFVGVDNDGLAGLEVGAERGLAGRPGRMVVERDPQGVDLPGSERTVRAARRGVDLVLTIDQAVQYEAEQALVAGVQAAQAVGGMAVVADVRTGDVLAMATVVGATPDHPAAPGPATMPNRPVTDVFEPGSTNKVVTVSAALEEGVVTPSTVLQVPQRLVVDGREFEDVSSHPTAMTVADIVRESSNVGTILVARRLGAERFDAYLRAYGFGSPTGLDLPGESPGIVLPLDQFNDTSLASMPVGSGIAVTAVQMLDVYRTVANGGVARAPRLVAATVDPDGVRRPRPLAPTRRVVSERTAAAMRSMLEGVVTDGTGTKAAVPGYRVAGKTGTARKPPYDHPPYRYVASFAGFAPAGAPRLAAIVVLDEPVAGTYGGQVAAPVFSRIMARALEVERVPPDPGPSTR